MDYSFKIEERLKSKERISELFQKGRLSKKGFIIIRFLPNDLGYNRLAISVPKRRIASAVKRNLIKRRIREIYRLHKSEIELGSDQVHYDMICLYLANELHSYDRIKKQFLKFKLEK